jgi:regulator of protease activity HflC (stomatin/prohibitin superfamily)
MKEKTTSTIPGGYMLAVFIIGILLTIGGLMDEKGNPGFLVIAIPALIFITAGFFTLQPNEGRVLVFFGNYVGTVRTAGFHWINPFKLTRAMTTIRNPENQQQVVSFKSKYKVSLRIRNFETTRLKVNDLRGNPIEIAAVVVWRIEDTAQALFDVDDYEDYIRVQSESALRHLASSYSYDHIDGAGSEVTLRSGGEAVHVALRQELQERLSRAGVVVEETRLTHLAYSPEIAGAMLRRQQAEAVIAARKKIVEGAVSMVQMALHELSVNKIVELDEERKAAMVGNLLVVLCGETEAKPIINTGTLYH